MVIYFEEGQIAGYGFGLCMFVFFNGFALYKSIKECHRIWTGLMVANIIAGIVITPLIYTIIIPVVYLIKSSNIPIKRSKKIDIKSFFRKKN
jgi:hypothetical protein